MTKLSIFWACIVQVLAVTAADLPIVNAVKDTVQLKVLAPPPVAAKACPKDIECVAPPHLYEKVVYELEPATVTQTHTVLSSKIHTLTSYTFQAVVVTQVAHSKGLCERGIVQRLNSRSTHTVIVHSTTTSHLYTRSLSTSTITHTHTVDETLGCIREISAPTDAPIGSIPELGGGTGVGADAPTQGQLNKQGADAGKGATGKPNAEEAKKADKKGKLT